LAAAGRQKIFSRTYADLAAKRDLGERKKARIRGLFGLCPPQNAKSLRMSLSLVNPEAIFLSAAGRRKDLKPNLRRSRDRARSRQKEKSPHPRALWSLPTTKCKILADELISRKSK
jgi:hypothetical protein